MANLLIKGLALPKRGDVLKLYIGPDGCAGYQDKEGLHKTKVTELQHHGLKDFGDILRIFDKVIHDVDDDTNALLCDLIAQIQAAPTIVEATDEG